MPRPRPEEETDFPFYDPGYTNSYSVRREKKVPEGFTDLPSLVDRLFYNEYKTLGLPPDEVDQFTIAIARGELPPGFDSLTVLAQYIKAAMIGRFLPK